MSFLKSVAAAAITFSSYAALAGVCANSDQCGYGGTCVIDGYSGSNIGYCIYSDGSNGGAYGCQTDAECFPGSVCNARGKCEAGPYQFGGGRLRLRPR